MDTTLNHIVHSGWLIKSPPEKRILKTKWRRRWFVLKLSSQIPGQYVLEYYTDATGKKLKGQIDLDQCEQVDAGLQLQIRKQNYDNMFDLRTSKRTYYLVAGTEEEMNKWVECICSVCGLKMEAIQDELALQLPSIESITTGQQQQQSQSSPNTHHGNSSSISHIQEQNDQRYSPQPSQNEQQQSQRSQLTQDQCASALLNYIPISECYTGKPNQLHSDQQNLPPPRPPKPATMLYNIQSQNHKPQSSFSFCQQDPQQQKSSGSILPPAPNLPALKTNRSFYLSNNKDQQNCVGKMPNNFYDTWHSRVKRPDFLTSMTHEMPSLPPHVNRDLKPNRRRILTEQQQLNSNPVPIKHENYVVNAVTKLPHQPFKRSNTSQALAITNNDCNNRHTLPRPLITSYTLRNNQSKMLQNRNNYCQLAHCEQPKHTNEDCERQYLDLDLDSSPTADSASGSNSNSNSPRNDNGSTNNQSGLVNPNSVDTLADHSVSGSIPNSKNNGTCHQSSETMLNSQNASTSVFNNHNNSNDFGNLNVGTTMPKDLVPGLATDHISDNSGTVYKIVDFVRTKALVETRLNANMYRSGAN